MKSVRAHAIKPLPGISLARGPAKKAELFCCGGSSLTMRMQFPACDQHFYIIQEEVPARSSALAAAASAATHQQQERVLPCVRCCGRRTSPRQQTL